MKEEILPELSKAKVFSKVDLKERFLQVELDKESSKLIVFHTPPFGITLALEIFQMKLDQNFGGLNGVFKIAGNILITGQGETEH